MIRITELRQRIESMQMLPSERAHALRNLESAEAFADGLFAVVHWVRHAFAPKTKRAPARRIAAH